MIYDDWQLFPQKTHTHTHEQIMKKNFILQSYTHTLKYISKQFKVNWYRYFFFFFGEKKYQIFFVVVFVLFIFRLLILTNVFVSFPLCVCVCVSSKFDCKNWNTHTKNYNTQYTHSNTHGNGLQKSNIELSLKENW